MGFYAERNHSYPPPLPDQMERYNTRLLNESARLYQPARNIAAHKYLPLMLFPPEIREEIYSYLLPNEDDICLGPVWKLIKFYNHRKYMHTSKMGSLRKYGDKCHTSILAVNSQVNAEASRVLYARIYTITISSNEVTFLTKNYDTDVWCAGQIHNTIRQDFPRTFPFHRIKALRIRLDTPLTIAPTWISNGGFNLDPTETYDWPRFWRLFLRMIETLGAITKANFPVKKLIVDASESCHFLAAQDAPKSRHRNIERLFRPLNDCVRNVLDCEIRLPPWAKDCPETIELAKECGRKISSIENSFGGMTVRTADL